MTINKNKSSKLNSSTDLIRLDSPPYKSGLENPSVSVGESRKDDSRLDTIEEQIVLENKNTEDLEKSITEETHVCEQSFHEKD